MQCYGTPPPSSTDPFEEQPKKAAVPPPADFFSSTGRSEPLNPSAEWKPAGSAPEWKPAHKEDSSTANAETVAEMVSQLKTQLSEGASSSSLMELLEGKNSIGGFDGTSLFTILMSPSQKLRDPIYEALPSLLAGMAGKADTGGQGDVSTWLCTNLVERTMICSKDDKRKVRFLI
jgi:hypothetical protein